MLVRITKLRSMPHGAPPAAWDSFEPGVSFVAEASLPIDWQLEGKLITPVSIGSPLEVLRVSRNGVPVLGVFTSSPVGMLYVCTRNSMYRIEPAGLPELPIVTA